MEEVFPWLNSTVEYVNPDGTPFIVENALDKDLTFCNLLLFEDGLSLFATEQTAMRVANCICDAMRVILPMYMMWYLSHKNPLVLTCSLTVVLMTYLFCTSL